MASSNQKIKLLYLMKILLENTDIYNPMTLKEIIDSLSAYGVSVERKALYSDIETLRLFGIEVETIREKSVGYYVENRTFQLPELKLLVDAVQSSKFITSKKSLDLISKISTLTSKYQAQKLNRTIHLADLPKNLNESIYYNVDSIHEAINSGKKINFKYFDYNTDKERVYRKNGEIYTQNPLALFWNDDKYYLICYNLGCENYTHYRVDRMADVNISMENSQVPQDYNFNVAQYTFGLFGMFAGEKLSAKLWFHNSLLNAVLDKFGKETTFFKDKDGFIVNVEVSNSPVFLSWIVQFGNQVKIISPKKLQTSLLNLLDEIKKEYT